MVAGNQLNVFRKPPVDVAAVVALFIVANERIKERKRCHQLGLGRLGLDNCFKCDVLLCSPRIDQSANRPVTRQAN